MNQVRFTVMKSTSSNFKLHLSFDFFTSQSYYALKLIFSSLLVLVLAGASQTGKTCFIFKLIDRFDEIVTKKVEKIIFFNEVWKDLFDNTQNRIPPTVAHNGTFKTSTLWLFSTI